MYNYPLQYEYFIVLIIDGMKPNQFAFSIYVCSILRCLHLHVFHFLVIYARWIPISYKIFVRKAKDQFAIKDQNKFQEVKWMLKKDNAKIF